MDKPNILYQKRILYTALGISLNKLLSATAEYSNSFKTEDFYTLSLSEARIEEYKQAYNRFVRSIAVHLTDAEQAVSAIASLLIEADSVGDESSTKELKELFDCFSHFCIQLENFRKSSEKAFAVSHISPTALHSGAQKLILYITTLIDKSKIPES